MTEAEGKPNSHRTLTAEADRCNPSALLRGVAMIWLRMRSCVLLGRQKAKAYDICGMRMYFTREAVMDGVNSEFKASF